MELGKRIAEIRKDHNLTQEGLAEICSVTRQTISNWENGKSYPDLETLVLISDTFDVSLDAMLKGDRKMVSEITKEQKQGRYSTIKMVVVIVIAIAIIPVIFFILDRTYTTLKPGDYQVTVKEITLDDVVVDEEKKIATYVDPELGEQTSYVFGGEEYARLLKSESAYEIVIKSDKYFDQCEHGIADYPMAIEVRVKQTNRSKLDGHKEGSIMTFMWFTDFDTIYDRDTYKSDDKAASVVWRK